MRVKHTKQAVHEAAGSTQAKTDATGWEAGCTLFLTQ